jgi:ABC-type nickel/cobalt efflux system permease component RcnA
LLILLFTLANGLLIAGIAAVFAMAIGVGLTVALIALAAVGVRNVSLAAASGRGTMYVFVQRGLAITGSAAILVFGSLFFLSAASRLF